jgi:two-component system chemotaxis sensor kinase CheA
MMLDAISEFSRAYPKDLLRNNFVDAMAFQSQVLSKLQRAVMKIRMVPVEQLFRRFPRIVRDVSKISGKTVELVLQGENTDLDKTILDALAEPLTHLVRNAVDHGIEAPQERAKAGKPEVGKIILNAYHQGNQVVIEVSDDGRGIDRDNVVNKAIEKGVVSREEVARLSDNEALNLIFHPGLSTAAKVTELSGRGMGMDVVKAVMERLKGSIHIHTDKGQGTTFQLKLPLTLAIIKALLFRVHERLYAVPLGSVHEITRANESEIHIVDNHEVVKLRDELLTLVRVGQMVTGKESRGKSGKVFVVVVAVGHRKYGLVVDSLAGEQELVIKALDETVLTTELVAGASVLGDGRVVLILNISAVIDQLGRASIDRRALGVNA